MTKLSPAEREAIRKNINNFSVSALARLYNVSRRTIQFTLNPEKLIKSKLNRKTWRHYYTKEKQAKYARTYNNKPKQGKPP